MLNPNLTLLKYRPELVLAIVLGMFSSLSLPTSAGAAEERLKLDKFEVTGSRIKRTDIEGVSSVMVMDHAFIEKSGFTSLSQLFRDVIYQSSGMVDEQFTQGFTPASAGIDLRGMGVNRTLVLVNGRRMPMFPFGQEGSASFVDINLIPLSAVKRVEVLKEGASAIYGSDAIAGVVNIILWDDYEGLETSLQYGQTSEGDGEEIRLNLIGGHTGEKGNVTFVVDYLQRDTVWARDREITASANGPIDDRSSFGNPGTIIRADGSREPDPRCPADQIVGTNCVYDYAKDVTLIPEVRQWGLLLSGDYSITDSINVFANANYTNRTSERDLAASSGTFAVPGGVNTLYPGEDVAVKYRLNELGPRTDEFETDSYNLLTGLNGYLDDWDWELAVGTGKIDTSSTGVSGYTTQADVEASIASGDLNLLGNSPGFNPEDISYITTRNGETELNHVDFEITGALLETRHGAVQAAIGAEYRDESYSEKFDPVTESGDILTIGGISGEGDRQVSAAYAEFSVPVLSNLELQLAGRYDDYSDFGSTFNPMLGLRWQPRDDLLVRANAGTGFKAPALHELHSNEVVSFESVFDPVVGEIVEVPTLANGNPDLEAEESENYTLGAVWDVTQHWDMSIDYWRIKNENAVTSAAQYYVNNENLFPDSVVRGPTDDIRVIFSQFQNVAAQKLWGIDLDTGVNWQTDQAGQFRFTLAGTYLGSFEQEPVEGAGFEELAGKDGRPEWRAQSALMWNKSAYAASLTLNYVGGYDRRIIGMEDDKVASWTTIDGQFNWMPGGLRGGKVTFGVQNIFDAPPPEDPYLEGWPFINRELHNPRGRFIYLGYKHDF
ncbi:MAG: TonB-dependent receptor [Gammaproteobacteria bacterium]|nr:TonB-dependent receptor [Gammaproteobacteria bacterium]